MIDWLLQIFENHLIRLLDNQLHNDGQQMRRNQENAYETNDLKTLTHTCQAI